MQLKTCVICKSAVENCTCGFDTMSKTELFLLLLRLNDLYNQHPGPLELEPGLVGSDVEDPWRRVSAQTGTDYTRLSSDRFIEPVFPRPKAGFRTDISDDMKQVILDQKPGFSSLSTLLQRRPRYDRGELSIEAHQKYPQVHVNEVFGFYGDAGEFAGHWVATDVKVFHMEYGPRKAVSEVTAKNLAGEEIKFRTAWDKELVTTLEPGFVDSAAIKHLPNEWVEVSFPEVDPFPILKVGKRIKTAEGADDSVITVTEVKLLQYNYGICNPDQYQLCVKVRVQQSTENGQCVGDTEFFTNNFTHNRAALEPKFFPYKDIIAVE